jgi:hypothetical protein
MVTVFRRLASMVEQFDESKTPLGFVPAGVGYDSRQWSGRSYTLSLQSSPKAGRLALDCGIVVYR